MPTADKLTIKMNEMQPRIVGALRAWQVNDEARRRFTNNPVEYLMSIGEEEFGEVGPASRLLFLLLSNEQFMEWSEKYTSELVERVSGDPARVVQETEQVYSDVMDAMAEFADRELMISLFGDARALERQIGENPSSQLAGCVFAILWVAVVVLPLVVVLLQPAPETNSVFLARDDLAQLADALTADLKETAVREREGGRLGDLGASVPDGS